MSAIEMNEYAALAGTEVGVSRWFEIDQIALEPADIAFLVSVRVMGRVVVDVQLLEPSDDVVLDPLQAPHALADEDGVSRSRDQNALHDRFETQVELDRRTLRDTKDLDA